MTTTYFDGNVLGVIRSFLPDSLNVSLACKTFYRLNKPIVTKVKEIVDLQWLINETTNSAYSTPILSNIMQLTLENAAFRGHIDFLRKHTNKSRKYLPSLMEKTARAGHITVLMWIYKLKHNMFDETSDDGNHHIMNIAAKYGRIDVLQWAIKIKTEELKRTKKNDTVCLYPKHLTSFAVVGESMPILEFLHKQSIIWCEETSFLAIKSNNCKVMDWLHQHERLSLNTSIGKHARLSENTTLQYFTCNGTEEQVESIIRFSTIDELNEHDFIDLIGFNIKLSDDQKKKLIVNCVDKGVTNWNFFMYNIFTCEDDSIVVSQEWAQWALENGCPWDKELTYHIFSGITIEEYQQNRERFLYFLKWAIRNGCPWNEYTIYEIDCLEDQELIDWALANGCPDFSSDIESEIDD